MDLRKDEKSPLRFEARELSFYHECVAESDLREGGVYFTVSYLDEDMLIPQLTPIVFVGKNLQRDDDNILYFQDYDSYRQGVRWLDAKSGVHGLHATFLSFTSGESTDVCEYDGALDSLLKCSLRRANRDKQ